MKIAIIGGGAAGFMAALTAASRHPTAEVVILEKTSEVLSKVRISGGGRCNLTNRPAEPAIFAANYPRGGKSMRSLLYQFGAQDTIDWFGHRGIKTKVEADGRVFPQSDRSESIINCLLAEAERLKVKIRIRTAVTEIKPLEEVGFQLTYGFGGAEYFDKVIVSPGGSPKSSAYDWLQHLGLKIRDPFPSLFTFNTPQHPLLKLMGISVPAARVHLEGTTFSYLGPLLITHWGFSGPAVLKLSAWGAEHLLKCGYQHRFSINWLGEVKTQDVLDILKDHKHQNAAKPLSNYPFKQLPARLWQYFINSTGIEVTQSWQTVNFKWLESLAQLLAHSILEMKGKTTFKEEFVTAGGIELDQINLKTMEAKNIPGLYFAGEILNVDGITGGYNFQHAWSSGFIAGSNV